MGALRLVPGVRVVRRGRDLLQVGLLPGRRVLVDRTPTVRQLLTDLRAGRTVEDHPLVVDLLDAGLLAPLPDPLPVRVTGALPPLEHEPLLRSWGVAPGRPDGPVLLLADGEVPRDEADPLVRRGVAHLAVRLVDGAALVGPFVVPGRTACLRCLDAHDAESDPEHVTVIGRYRGAPTGADPALATLALAWAVRDLRAHRAGQRPSTWSRTWQLGPEPTEMSATSWLRHPLCGCSWAGDHPVAGTMGA